MYFPVITHISINARKYTAYTGVRIVLTVRDGWLRVEYGVTSVEDEIVSIPYSR